MPSASLTSARMMAGSGVADILNPRPAVYTRDHVAENRSKMKELEMSAVARRIASEMAVERAVAAAAPSGAKGKFSYVESKLAKAGLGRAGTSPTKAQGAAPGGGSPGGDEVQVGALPHTVTEGRKVNFLRAKSRESVLPPMESIAPFKREQMEGVARKAAVPKVTARPAVSPWVFSSVYFVHHFASYSLLTYHSTLSPPFLLPPPLPSPSPSVCTLFTIKKLH
jgi:hypothetical protein